MDRRSNKLATGALRETLQQKEGWFHGCVSYHHFQVGSMIHIRGWFTASLSHARNIVRGINYPSTCNVRENATD